MDSDTPSGITASDILPQADPGPPGGAETSSARPATDSREVTLLDVIPGRSVELAGPDPETDVSPDLHTPPEPADPLIELIRNAPGPSPWCVRGAVGGQSPDGEDCHWVSSAPDEPFQGHLVLETPSGVALMAVKSPTTVASGLAGNRLLVVSKRSHPDVLDIALYSVDRLRPIEDPRAAAKILEAPDRSHIAAVEPVSRLQIPRRMLPGYSPFHFPAPFADIGELALVTTLSRTGPPGSTPSPELEAGQAAVLVIDPNHNRIEVLPQDWFREGPYRHGYQWLTRAARDPETGLLVGEGIRIGRFMLDATGRQVGRWLLHDPRFVP